MSELRDYVSWHAEYDDPTSGLAQRLQRVREHIRNIVDERGVAPVRVASVCAGDGRDILGVCAEREDRDRFSGTLVELDPRIAAVARERIARDRLVGFEVREADAGSSDTYVGAVPADLLLLVGVFGNIVPEEVERLIRTAPQLCAEGADLVWTARVDQPGLSESIRGWLEDAGFAEVAWDVPQGSRSSVGRARLVAAPQPLVPGRELFTFFR